MSIDHSLFPSSWKVVPISDVVFFQEGPGVRKFQYTDSGVKLLNGGNINNGILNLNTTERYISKEEAYGKYEHFLVDDGDLLIACSGVVVDKFDGKIAYAKKEHLPLCMNTSTMRFKSLNPKVLHLDFFRWFLTTIYFKRQLQQLITGSAQLNFGPSHIKQMVLPLPPLETQKKIAAVLEKADQLRQDCQQMEQELNSLAQSVFIDMFGDPVTNPKGWDVKPLSNVANVVTGNTPSRAKSEYYGSDIEWIKSGNINTPSDYLTTAGEYLSEAGKKVGRVVQSGSILMTCIAGSPDCIGNIAMADREVSFNQQINALVPKNNKLNAEFLFILLKVGKKIVQSASTNSMKGMISKSKLESIKLPFPPYDEQCDFSEIYVKLQKSVKAQAEQVIDAELLFNSLMQKAFKGELNL